MPDWCLSCQPQSRAADKAVLRHHGSGDQTSTPNGETAHGSVYAARTCCDQGTAIVYAVPGSLSHAPDLETSTTSRPARPRSALAAATAALGLAVHDLVCGRFPAGALRDGPRLLCGPASTPPTPGEDLCRLRESAGQTAGRGAACCGYCPAWPPGPGL